jgi:hypothetical protein
MRVYQAGNGKFYLCTGKKQKEFKKDIWLLKDGLSIGYISIPKELQGKRVKICLEVI